MIEEREKTRHSDTVNSLEIKSTTANTFGRLAHVASIIDARLEALDADDQGPNAGLLQPLWRAGPAFELHITSGLADLIADDECRKTLRHIVALGESARVVTWVYEPLEDVSEALSPDGFLSAELMVGRALRHSSQGAGR